MTKQYLTIEGKKAIEEKLEHYKKVLRPDAIEKIGIARAFGDLSENAEYDTAKDEQGRIEAEIKEMEELLLFATVVKKEKLSCDKVEVGVKVCLFDEEFEEEVEYSIVGTQESNPKESLISNESPLGSALLGKKVGENVTVSTPNGEAVYKILSIKI